MSNFFSGALSPGSAAAAPLKFATGVNTTTPQAGAVEYDGAVFYSNVVASERGVIPSVQFALLTAAYTLTSQTAAQKLLNATANGALTLAVGTYEFECEFSLSGMSASSGSFGFALGGTAVLTQMWTADAVKTAPVATPAATSSTFNTAANAALVAANLLTAGYASLRGILRVTTAGTVIPQVSLGVAAPAIVGANSYFKVSPLGSNAVASVGNWS